jgi:hypothetical protein
MDYLTVYEYDPVATNLFHLVPILVLAIIGFGGAYYLRKLFKASFFSNNHLLFLDISLGR